ncbi:hypothetical protein HPP92_004675 [Vanilla planifolia]|uniref:MADS-box domain-containing protein n=1 Tax=Vanilla planifolia TaxID=51239 RepID=A0A835RRY8_VANPL|nr:hypothetical protein HPP92_004675 [Vanilla planifolia]
MVREKTEMRRIENAASRQVTFSKRRNGLLKRPSSSQCSAMPRSGLSSSPPAASCTSFPVPGSTSYFEYKQNLQDLYKKNKHREVKSQNAFDKFRRKRTKAHKGYPGNEKTFYSNRDVYKIVEACALLHPLRRAIAKRIHVVDIEAVTWLELSKCEIK